MRLNKEQEKISYMKPSGHSLIKGIAGSGKTTVGIYRIPFLLNNYCSEEEDSILLVTYNKTLVNYMNYIYDKIKKDYNEKYLTLFKVPKEKIKITTVDSLIYMYYLSKIRRENKEVLKNVTNHEKLNIINEYSEKIFKEYADVNLLREGNKKVLLDEIEWIKACDYSEDDYQNADRIGVGKHEEHLQRIPKNSKTREALFNLMINYTKELERKKLIDFNDIRKIALEEIKKNPKKKFTHIIIDESQDLSKIQLEFIKEMYLEKDYSSLSFLFDSSQSIYSQSWLGNGRSFTTIGINMVGKSKSLSKNFRTTTQISQAAYSLLKKSTAVTKDENYVKPFLVDKQGEYPIYKHFKDEKKELEYLKEILLLESEKNQKNEIVIVARSRNQLVVAKNYLEKNNIAVDIIDRDNSNFDNDSIKMMTMHSVKGIESKIVILINLNEKVIPYHSSNDDASKEIEEVMEKKLLYVGMTRATESLYMLSSGIPSKFISEINNKYLKLRKESKLKSFYNVPIEEYRFKEKVLNIYSSEEKIRQWMLKELIETYKYPEELIEIESSVSIGSKKYFADIAIFKYQGEKKIPFIFIETKSLEADMEDGKEQLKSYMTVKESIELGVLTNGSDIDISDRKEKKVKDIPNFHIDMLKEEIEDNIFIDIKKSKKLSFVTDDGDSGIIEVNYGENTEIYLKEEQKKIPIYGKISTGIPIFMNPDIEDVLYLPNDLIKTEDCFALKVKGDSMINAEIDDGDYVVLRQDIAPNNGDIVAAAIDEEATLKRLMKMRNSILLLPENPEYEEIYINEQDVNLLGVAVGIVKRSKNVL